MQQTMTSASAAGDQKRKTPPESLMELNSVS
jgi:hypothetical protein